LKTTTNRPHKPMVKEEDAKTSASSLADVVAPGRLDTADMKPWFTKSEPIGKPFCYLTALVFIKK
jgi:hypothetical protein